MEMNQVLLAGTFIGSGPGWLAHEDLGVSSTFTTCFLGFLLSDLIFFDSDFWFRIFLQIFLPQTFGRCSPNPPSPPWQCLEAGYHASSDSRQWHDSGNRPWQLQGLLGGEVARWVACHVLIPQKYASRPKGFSPFWEEEKNPSRFELLKFDDFCLKSLVDLQDLLRIQPVKKNQTLQPKYWTSLH